VAGYRNGRRRRRRVGCPPQPCSTPIRNISCCPSAHPFLQGDGAFTINGRTLAAYFPRASDRRHALEPLIATQACGAFDVWLTVAGGGLSGQAGAVRHGLSNALARYDPYLKPGLKRRE
jgi:ribosomal protein S9